MQKLITFLGICLAGSFFTASAQHSIVYSQYIFNGLLINPAYAGSHVQMSVSLTYRNQWVNLEGAPQTTTLGAHTSLRRDKIGVGILATHDRIGSYSNTGFFASYAYKIKNPLGGVFSFGVQAGFNNFKGDYTDLTIRPQNQNDPTFSGFLSQFKPNFGGGVFYYNKRIFAGFAVPSILTYSKSFSETLEQLKQPRYYYLHGGMLLPLNREETVKFNPSILVRAQDGTPLSGDLNLNFVFYDQVSIGSSYRSGDAIMTFVNFKLSEKFHFAYSYDWTTSDIRKYSRGTHEVMLSYRTRINGIHRNLECPGYFHH